MLHTLSIRAGFAAIGQGWFNDGAVYMPVTPMFHVHAWGFPYIATMLGLKQVYCGRYVADSVVALFQREKVTLSHCVPTILRMLLDSAKTTGINLSGWKMVIGGAILPQALAREALELGLDIYAGYGMSETCPGLTVSSLMPEMNSWAFERQVEIRCKAGRPSSLGTDPHCRQRDERPAARRENFRRARGSCTLVNPGKLDKKVMRERYAP